MKYCPYCGAGLEQDMRFCPNCGKPFAEGKTNPYISENTQPERKTIEVASAPPKAKKQGKILALVAVLVLVAIGVGIFAFMPKEEPAIPFIDDTEAIAQAAQSVVMLSCYDKDGELYSTGSGFAVFDDGVILTNYHVIEQEVYQVKAQTESGMTFECPTVLAYDAEKDIAILKADRETGLTLLPFGNATELQKGAKVVAIGSPLGLINSVSTGVFSGYIDDEFGSLLQFTAAISHGSSGGALFNDAGEVIGITFASYDEGQNLNLAVPIDDAKALYDYSVNHNQNNTLLEEITQTSSTYSADYVMEHFDELLEQEITVSGIISYVEGYYQNNYYKNNVKVQCIGIVADPAEVLDFTYTGDDWTGRLGDCIKQRMNKEAIEVSFDYPMDEFFELFEPNKTVTIKGELVLNGYKHSSTTWYCLLNPTLIEID